MGGGAMGSLWCDPYTTAPHPTAPPQRPDDLGAAAYTLLPNTLKPSKQTTHCPKHHSRLHHNSHKPSGHTSAFLPGRGKPGPPRRQDPAWGFPLQLIGGQPHHPVWG